MKNAFSRIRADIARLAVCACLSLSAANSTDAAQGELTLYCGRGEEFVQPVIDKYEQKTGVRVHVRYGGTAELTVTLLEEGNNSPADVFIAQDAGALGALKKNNRLAVLPDDIPASVMPRFRSSENKWVGVSGRARVLVYNTDKLASDDLPPDLFGFCDPAWRGRLGWAPENGSFQSFVTALVVREGRDRALAWLQGIQANEPRVFAKNSAIVAAVAAGEIDAGFVNHYYLHMARRSQPGLKAGNYYFPGESAGSLVNLAGAGILASSSNKDAAADLIRFLLREDIQRHFLEKTCEYPVLESIDVTGSLTPLSLVPNLSIDLNDLDGLEGTLELMHEAGVF